MLGSRILIVVGLMSICATPSSSQTLRLPENGFAKAIQPLTDDYSLMRLSRSLPLMKPSRLNLFADVVAACIAFGDASKSSEPCDEKAREYLVKYSDEDDKNIVSGLSAAFNQKKGDNSAKAKAAASDALTSFYKTVAPPNQNGLQKPMTTYLFMLTPETEQALVDRVIHELEQQFPEHEFLGGGADIPEFENSILAVHGTAGSGEDPGTARVPNQVEVQTVKEAFAAILEDARNWKPS